MAFIERVACSSSLFHTVGFLTVLSAEAERTFSLMSVSRRFSLVTCHFRFPCYFTGITLIETKKQRCL